MAFQDDADDENENTSSEQDFEAPIRRRSASSFPSFDFADDKKDSTPVDLSEASNGGNFANDPSDGRDQEAPPWAMAPAADSTNDVSQLDAPGGNSHEQSPVEGSDPYQIPVDYTSPDFFASRMSRRRGSDDYDDATSEVPPAGADAIGAANDDLIPDMPARNLDEEAAPTTDKFESTEPVVERDFIGQVRSPEPAVEFDLPAPDAAGAPPVRRSMADDELLTWIDNPENQSTGTLSVIEVLEAQLRLREQEAREYREWETTLNSQPSPAADEAAETPAPQDAEAPENLADLPAVSATPAPSPVAPAVQLPSWDVAPPSDTWSPSADFDDEMPPAAHADSAGSITPPLLDDDGSATLTDDVGRAEKAALEPEPQVEPEQVAMRSEAEFGLLSFDGNLPAVAPEIPATDGVVSSPAARQFEQSPELPADEDGDYDEIPFTPPPLVEPGVATSTPRSDLDEHVSFGDFGFKAPLPGFPEAGADAEADATGETEAAAHAVASATMVEESPEDGLNSVSAGSGDATSTAFSFASQHNPRHVPAAPQSFDDLLTANDSDDPLDSNPIPFAVPQPATLSTALLSHQPLDLEDVVPTAQRVFSLEESGLEPTPVDRRIGHAARLFWLWFAANSSIVSIGLGAAVFAVGMSLRQSVVAILAGVALSFIPLGLTTLAGKRSGQPTMVISRSTFGLLGNIVPALVALVARLFWGAVLLWVLASSVAIVLIGSALNMGLGDRQLLLISLAVSFLIALVVAFAGYPLFARIQLILSIISGVLVVGLIVFTAQYIDVTRALTTPDGSWLLTITGAVLVFSFLGLVWAYSGADIARYQRPSSSGAASALSATFGATLPAFVLIVYGAVLAASDPAIARGFLASPLDTLLLLLPGWYPIPLLLAAALSLLSGITLSLYSGGFALQAIGVRLPRQWSIVIVGVLVGGLAILFAFGVNGGINEIFRDVATTLAVPTAAWAGIFASETMIRNRRLDSAALTSRGGIYADIRWVNLSALILISAIGFALTSATIEWLSWQGYGFTALGVDLSSELAGTDLGVLVALVLGILTPIIAGIPAIRRQESGRPEGAAHPA
jgi:purine-cytosine permease-like protein